MMPFRNKIETLLFRQKTGLSSRFRIGFYSAFGMSIGTHNRFERIRVRRPSQIEIGARNSLTEGCWLWPIDSDHKGVRIRLGDCNYFNRDVMLDACSYIKIGSFNMFGPGVYITDSNHTLLPDRPVAESPMSTGVVDIGDGGWIGAKAVILKDVTLGDRCVVGAGAVVTKSFPAGSVIAGVPARLLKRVE